MEWGTALKQSKPGIRSIIFYYLMIFTAIILVVLWLFQVVFLDNFYKAIRTRNIKNSAQTIEKYLDDDNFENYLYQICKQNDVCSYVVDVDGNIMYSVDTIPFCTIHSMTYAQLQELIYSAQKNNGESIKRYFYANSDESWLSQKLMSKTESIVFTKILTTSQNKQYVLMINATITPVDATIGTLRTQIILITFIMLLIALLLAWIMSKKISNPIISINQSSKELAKGNYDVSFADNDYKEIAELGETLNYASKELKKTEDLQRELIANISHDLRTPLTMIIGYAEVIRDLPGEDTPENIQIIIDEAQRLTSLVNDVMDLSKLKAGVQELNECEFDLTQSILDIIGRYKKLVEQDGYIIEFNYNRHIHVYADELKISQVIYNLINNAVTYTGEDKKVVVNQSEDDEYVRISVIDSGEGIAAGEIHDIFDRYYKIEKSHKRAIIGTGLGLSIVKGVLSAHKAQYGVDSEIGKGSEFYFILKKI